jgi:hypothetical protein
LPDLALVSLAIALRTSERSVNDNSLKLAFKFFLLALILGRIGITATVYWGDVVTLLTANAITPSIGFQTVGNVIQFFLTIGVLFPVCGYVLLQIVRTNEIRNLYIGLVGFAYALTFFIPRGLDFAFGILFYSQGGLSYVQSIGYISVLVERLAVFVLGVLFSLLFVRLLSKG